MQTISVVIPLYNKAREIERCLQSVAAQTIAPHEILVVDDGSTDQSAEIVSRGTDERVRLIQQTNQGVAAARNRGIQESSGDGIAFLDADDEWKPDFLKTVLTLSHHFPQAGLYATGCEEIADSSGPPLNHRSEGLPEGPGGALIDFFRSMYRYPPVCSSNTLCRREVFDVVGGFPVGEELAEDWDMWSRIALRYPVAYDPSIEAIYHIAADNRATQRESFSGRDTALLVTLRSALEAGEFPYTRPAWVKRFMAKHLLEIAKHGIAAGERSGTRARIREAWQLHALHGKCLRWWFKSLV
ncbi:MAG: glycosyltransferase family 2 protein [Lentisphaerae bacterium]|nr:glycosyltransferase family 2 protein [Lentisphaerota bacterium]